jgi:hypothetical protein
MRGTWNGLVWLAVTLLSLTGCTTTEDHLRPPKRPEEYTVPPDDRRYSQAPEYPKEMLNNDVLQAKNKDNGPGGNGPGGPGPSSKGFGARTGGY